MALGEEARAGAVVAPEERKLVAFLQREHANERGAALAYRGHAASVRRPEERAKLLAIEAEEWHHRERLAALLTAWGSGPAFYDRALGAVGAGLGWLCHVTGWLLPMLGAGWIERRNAQGYFQAARWASALGRPELAAELRALGAVEVAHHAWFYARVREHRWGRYLPLRPPLDLPPAEGGMAASPEPK